MQVYSELPMKNDDSLPSTLMGVNEFQEQTTNKCNSSDFSWNMNKEGKTEQC